MTVAQAFWLGFVACFTGMLLGVLVTTWGIIRMERRAQEAEADGALKGSRAT